MPNIGFLTASGNFSLLLANILNDQKLPIEDVLAMGSLGLAGLAITMDRYKSLVQAQLHKSH